MPESIGKIIKQLRKERNLTQDELAEQLNVTAQAVSKWENETGLPDISQVLPLASVFGVSTDVLFGKFGQDDNTQAQAIVKAAYEKIKSPADSASVYEAYKTMQDGLSRYPNNDVLLMNSLELGICLSYPENDTYNEKYANDIYHECIRQANIIISYSKNTTDILRANMIMVLLHAAYGNLSQARIHADRFPWRADMTIHDMYSFIAHMQKDYKSECFYCQKDFMYHFEAISDDIARLGCTYESLGKYSDALKVFEMLLGLIKTVFQDESEPPAMHARECGDVYMLMARVNVKLGNTSQAIELLEKMTDYDILTRMRFDNEKLKTPLLRDVDFQWYPKLGSDKGMKKLVLGKLADNAFDSIKNEPRFQTLIHRVSE